MLVHQNSKNQWWFATWGDGLCRYDGKTIVHFTTQHGLGHNRTDQIVDGSKVVKQFSVYCDREGTIWLGTNEDGAFRFNGTSFERFSPEV